jgi:2,3-bisphosphoglycerate-independent phosphoglycerate mutase
VVGTIIDKLPEIGDCRILVLPDHPTPVEKRTHTADPVPYLLFDSRNQVTSGAEAYTEAETKRCGRIIYGPDLMANLLERG